MPLTANTLPSIVPDVVAAFDAATSFASAQTLTATGYMGSPTQVDLGQGRMDGLWSVDITNIDISSGDETYRFHLMGSNDVNWANGNVELLAFHDIAAATAGRLVPTILGASPAIPATGLSGTILRIPFMNLMQRIVYRYVRGYLVIGGTTPTVTFTSWLSPDEDD